MSSGNRCCGQCFRFDTTGLENVHFEDMEGTTILVIYTKDGSIYLGISFDCGETFQEHKNIMQIQGDLKDIKVAAKNNKFVVATLESISNKDIARAVAGSIDPNQKSFTFRECTRRESIRKEGTGRINNISVGFRPYQQAGQESVTKEEESCDTHFWEQSPGIWCAECNGHG